MSELLRCLTRIGQLQRETFDQLALSTAVDEALLGDSADPSDRLRSISQSLHIRAAKWANEPNDMRLPAVVWDPSGRWGVLRGRNALGEWLTEWIDSESGQWKESVYDSLPEHRFANIDLMQAYRASKSPVLRVVVDEILAHRPLLIESAVGGLLIAILAVLTSFYSMQVYDRVVPTGATSTLLVLTLGMFVSIVFEYFAKRLRSTIYEQLVDRVDQRLSRLVMLRFLSIRLDQMPASVGSLASQIRGYETVRGFLVNLSTQFLVDAPFALWFALLIAFIGGWLAAIPLLFLVLSVAAGLYHKGRIEELGRRGQQAANLKTGLLVEVVEGSEIIKSGQGGSRMLNRWQACTDESRDVDLQTRRISEHSQYLLAGFQQIAYVLMVALGALMVTRAELTMGALIACSILSGRVLTPVGQLASQLAQWAHTKAALQGLDRIWALEDDHHGQVEPIVIENIRGNYRFEGVTMSISGRPVLAVPKLAIKGGEKIAVLGPVGAGKTTLLRLLSGMYKPQQGRILLEDVDVAYLSKPLLAESIGYLPQDGRLFSGTLRENLVLGLIDPGDEAILAAARKTGLLDSVILSHEKGLQREISEGGTGLSGGQRQLVNLTRVFLRAPSIWLLDEPTSSLDRNVEQQVLQALKTALEPQHTLILVTHKTELLPLVDRIIVIANHQIILDGPRDAVIARLQQGNQPSAQTRPSPPTSALQPGGSPP